MSQKHKLRAGYLRKRRDIVGALVLVSETVPYMGLGIGTAIYRKNWNIRSDPLFTCPEDGHTYLFPQ